MSDSGGTENDPPEHPLPPDSTWGQGPTSEPTEPGQHPGATPGGGAEPGAEEHPGKYQPPGAPGGYGQPGGYEPQGAPGGYGQPGGYPGQAGGYPGQTGGYPGQAGAYPGQAGGYPGQTGAYPGQAGGYPGPGGPPGYNQPGAWGQQQPAWQMGPGYTSTQTSGKAIAALVCAIASVFIVPIILAIVGFVLGLVGRRDINRSGGRLGGSGMCLAAIIVSVLSFIGWVIIIVAIIAAANSTTTYDYNYNSLHALVAPVLG